jgi:Raf kinase inhibitor-like YbhB/YbcL family protein
MKKFVPILALALLVTSCAPSQTESTPVSNEEVPMSFKLTSSAFAEGQAIPVKYSCKGSDMSPPLEWGEELPQGTKSLALIVDDPDAPMGTWVHWVLWNIPTTAHGWPENTPTDPELVNGAMQGKTSAGGSGYHGPCPPSGTHRYFFKLYALNTKLSLPAGADKDALFQAMDGHVLAQVELMGTFSK